MSLTFFSKKCLGVQRHSASGEDGGQLLFREINASNPKMAVNEKSLHNDTQTMLYHYGVITQIINIIV